MRNPQVVRAFKNAGLWTLVEFIVGDGSLLLIFLAFLVTTRPKDVESSVITGPMFTINVVSGTIAMLVLWSIFRRRARGATLSDLGYRFSKAAVVAGSLAAAAVLTIGEFGVYKIDEALFGPEPSLEMGLRDAGLAVAILFLVSNGFLAPVVEEYVWRGMVQRGFGMACGPLKAIIVTAILFTAKHIVTDLSFVRTTQLLFFSFLVGYIAFLWGTWSSTIVHLLANTGGTLLFILDTFDVVQIC